MYLRLLVPCGTGSHIWTFPAVAISVRSSGFKIAMVALTRPHGGSREWSTRTIRASGSPSTRPTSFSIAGIPARRRSRLSATSGPNPVCSLGALKYNQASHDISPESSRKSCRSYWNRCSSTGLWLPPVESTRATWLDRRVTKVSGEEWNPMRPEKLFFTY